MNTRNPVLLCVDDEEANLKLLEKLLVPRGFAVVSAASGKDALLKIKTQAIDLVLLDVIIPGMDGFAVCRQIKEDKELRNIPVIMVTALTDKKDRIRGIEAGADEFLSKPFDLGEVLARIKVLLKIKGLDDERKLAESQKEAARAELQKSHDELEFKVRERTTELTRANEMLQADIIERKLAEEKIKNSLAEKEVLLKEVHHRVKNNLMTIIGLIKMQETKANNEMFNPLLQELESRVRSMALVHEILHKSDDLAQIDVQNYIETMGAHIRSQFGGERAIRFSVRAAGVEVGLDIAIPCGLILNEMIVNAYKHAFPGDKPCTGSGDCEIMVAGKHENGILTLTVADNGIGQPVGVDIENPQSLGLRLIKMLSQQINGSLEMERAPGTVYHLKFPMTVP